MSHTSCSLKHVNDTGCYELRSQRRVTSAGTFSRSVGEMKRAVTSSERLRRKCSDADSDGASSTWLSVRGKVFFRRENITDNSYKFDQCFLTHGDVYQYNQSVIGNQVMCFCETCLYANSQLKFNVFETGRRCK